ncbi:MAG: hypothetical protein QXP56_06520 [Archaeoglobaceae archaeon]
MKRYSKKTFRAEKEYYAIKIVPHFPEEVVLRSRKKEEGNVLTVSHLHLRRFLDSKFRIEETVSDYDISSFKTLSFRQLLFKEVSEHEALVAIARASAILSNAKDKTETVKNAFTNIYEVLKSLA